MSKSRQLILVLTIILLNSAVLFAQNGEREIFVGLKAGFSLPNLVGGSDQEITRDYKSRFAANFGGFVDVQLHKNTSLQFEIDYAPQGGKRNGIQPVTQPIPGLPVLPAGNYYFANFNNTAKLDYIEFPVLLKYRVAKQKKVGFYLNGGPYFGYLMKATQVTSGTSSLFLDNRGTVPVLIGPNTPFPSIPFNAETDVTDSLNRFNFGVTGGGGITFKQKKNYFFVDGRVAYGLTTLQKDTINDGKSRTGNLVISFGYAFSVK
ncbi:MAG: PorT family protein [Pyrinomonadaceae bacterium]|nr:PorT family protein [Acidobacteriota bacterium]MBK7934834.1 PorT family protein [Acidobacteriota bacterium]MBP7375199.1 PorT family protein [Pyrinomonadaceae bacterium]